MGAEQRVYNFHICIVFIYLLHMLSSRFTFSVKTMNSTAMVPTHWINSPSLYINSTNLWKMTPILRSGDFGGQAFFFGFCCGSDDTECFLGVLIFQNTSLHTNGMIINNPQLVWSANRNYPVKHNATLGLGQDGNLVLADADGTLVWSTNTTGKSVSGLKLDVDGNLILFDKTRRTIWQSFDLPTDCFVNGQGLVSGRRLRASVSASNWSEGLFSFAVLNGSLVAYTDTDPPQYYYNYFSPNELGVVNSSSFFDFDGRAFHAPFYGYPMAQFMKLEPDGRIRVIQWGTDNWQLGFEDLMQLGNCGYPLVCGRYSICTNDGQCNCPVEGNFYRPINRNPNLGCSQLKPISCNSSQYHSLIELKDTTYFAFETNYNTSSNMWFEGTKLEDCKMACLSNCSCKAAIWSATLRKNCLLLNEVFSLKDNWQGKDKTTVFLKVQNSTKGQNHSLIISGGKHSRPLKVIAGSALAALMGIILSISMWLVVYKKKTLSGKANDLLDLAPILPGILTRFSFNELAIITEDFTKKLGEGGFGSVYEGTLKNGNKIAVKCLNGVGQVKDSFLTEVKIVGSIHHVNLVKLIGFCAEKDHRLLVYEYMVNGSLDKWIFHKNKENGLTWHTRQRIISDIAKGLAYLHEECSQKIIHLDIKPQNILLDQNFNAKIADFGLSKLIEKDKSKIMTRMRGTPGYLAPEWLRSVITEKVDVYAFGIVLLEILCGRKNLDWSQADEEDVHLLTVFRRKAEQEALMDLVDENDDMLHHKEVVKEMMSLAAWCLQGDFTKRPSMSLVVKVLDGLVSVETNLDYDFTNLQLEGASDQQREATISSKLPSVLSGPR